MENAHKAAYLIKSYPEKTLAEIMELMAPMTAIELNTALWWATEAGLVTEPDKLTQIVTLAKEPDKWFFGEAIENIEDQLVYAFGQLGKKEADLDETEITNWLAGYIARDQLIAVKHAIETKKLATYELTDPKDLKSTYTFYTLYENGEQQWGKNRFKVKPTGDEVPVDPAEGNTADEVKTDDAPEAGAESEK